MWTLWCQSVSMIATALSQVQESMPALRMELLAAAVHCIAECAADLSQYSVGEIGRLLWACHALQSADVGCEVRRGAACGAVSVAIKLAFHRRRVSYCPSVLVQDEQRLRRWYETAEAALTTVITSGAYADSLPSPLLHAVWGLASVGELGLPACGLGRLWRVKPW